MGKRKGKEKKPAAAMESEAEGGDVESTPVAIDDQRRDDRRAGGVGNNTVEDSESAGDAGDDNDDDDGAMAEADEKKKKKKVRRLSLTEAENFGAKLRRRGILYVARLPPRMNPAKIKSILSEFGTVTRVYLAEEDKTARTRRKRLGGGGGKRYTEGWVEFEKKKVAKRVGEALNNTQISGQKKSVHYGDLWNVKYLRKFRWEHLTERVAYERRVREQKVRVEMMQARRENAAYASLVEAGKAMERIEERRGKRQAKEAALMADGSGKVVASKRQKIGNGGGGRKSFRQTAPVKERAAGAAKRAVLGSLV